MRSVLLALLAMAASVQAATVKFEPVGVFGNSGEAGSALVRISPFVEFTFGIPAGSESYRGNATGLAVDKDITLWVSGGDTINRYSINGFLIERYRLEPSGSRVDSRTFAVLNDTLYFFGRLPNAQTAHTLFALPMNGEPTTVTAKPVEGVVLPPRRREWLPYVLAPQPLQGKLVMVWEPKDLPENQIAVDLIDPAHRSIQRAFTLEAAYPKGAVVDREERIYLGAWFGHLFKVSGVSNPCGITLVRADGTTIPGFPVQCTKTPAQPTQFSGWISLADGALWDGAWYGFLARLDLNGKPSPGKVVEWHHELGYPSQVAEIAKGMVAVTTAAYDALYLAKWSDTEGFRFVRRIGCLNQIGSLAISEDGWVAVSTARSTLFWRWEDGADAPPRKAEWGTPFPSVPGFFYQDTLITVASNPYQPKQLRLCRSNPRPSGRNHPDVRQDDLPFSNPKGLTVAVEQPREHRGTVFISTEQGQIFKAPIDSLNFWVNVGSWEQVKLAEGKQILGLTDIVALPKGHLLTAVEGSVCLLEPSKEGYREVWRFNRWGDGDDQHFGASIRIAADGPWLVVSDTQRHRILLFDWTTRQLFSQFGETDQPGDDLWHLNRPTLIAIRGQRIIVADENNQRVVKILLTTM